MNLILIIILAMIPFTRPAIDLDQAQVTMPDVACDRSLMKHIYHPKRLVIKSCQSVVGTFVDATHGRNKDGCRHEKDGDGHCWIRLDPGQESLLNDGNLKHQDGNLVFEPICRYRVTQTDAALACLNYHQDLALPPVGSHVRIIGEFVFDSQHGHNEIHPVTKIIVEGK